MDLPPDFFKCLFLFIHIVTNVTVFSCMFKLIQKLAALKQYSETIVVFACMNVLRFREGVANIGFFSFIQIVPPATNLH